MSGAEGEIFQIGEIVASKYRIERVIGRGGMGVVYAAHHELLGKTVALKVVLPEIAASSEVIARFMNEARSSARIESEHVAQVLDVGQLPNQTPYMVMELLEGEDLDARLEKRGAVPVQELADLLVEALDGVAHAHALGIVHRDLKPANLFVATRKGRQRVKVLDFGIAKALRTTPFGAVGAVTSTKSILGSPAFMAPEQLRSSKSVDARADIWSMGVIAYQLSTGVLPYDAEDVGGFFAAILEQEPRPLRSVKPDLPEEFEKIVLRCLQKKPGDRYQNAYDLASALAPFGTKIAARALEQIEALDFTSPAARIPQLTLDPAPRTSTPTVVADATSSPELSLPPSAVITAPKIELEATSLAPPATKTDGTWATSGGTTKKRTPWLVFGGIGAVVLLVVIGAIASVNAHRTTATAQPLVTSLNTSAATTLPADPSQASSATPVVTTAIAPASASVAAADSAIAPPTSTAAPHASASAKHSHHAGAPASSSSATSNDDIFRRN